MPKRAGGWVSAMRMRALPFSREVCSESAFASAFSRRKALLILVKALSVIYITQSALKAQSAFWKAEIAFIIESARRFLLSRRFP